MILLRPPVELIGGITLLAVAAMQSVEPTLPPETGSNLITTLVAALGASGILGYAGKRVLDHYLALQKAEREDERKERERQHAESTGRFTALTAQVQALSERDGERVAQLITVHREEVTFWRTLYLEERSRCSVVVPDQPT